MLKQMHLPIFMHSVTQLHTSNSSNSMQKGTWHFPFLHLEMPFKNMVSQRQDNENKKLQSLKSVVRTHVLTYFPVGALLYKKVNLVKAVRNRLVRTLQITAMLGSLFCCFPGTTEKKISNRNKKIFFRNLHKTLSQL